MAARRSRVEMDPKLRRLFQRLDKDISDPVTREIAASAEQVFRETVPTIPVDEGDLRDSLGLRIRPFSAEIGFDPKRFAAKWRKAGWRAHFIHNGTKGAPDRNIPPLAPNPFLRNVWDRLKDALLQRQRQAVAEALKKASGG